MSEPAQAEARGGRWQRRLGCLLGIALLSALAWTAASILFGEHHPVLGLMSECTGVRHARANYELDTTFVAVADLRSETLLEIRDAFALQRMGPDAPRAALRDPALRWDTSLGFQRPWWTPSADLSQTYFMQDRGESILLKAEGGRIYFRHFIH